MNQMCVWVQFYGVQRNVTGAHELRISIGGGETVRDILNYVLKDYPDLSFQERDTVVTVNSRISTLDYAVRPEDTIAFLPHIGGG